MPLILTRICGSFPSASAAWGYDTRPLGMPMGQVEDPSYGSRGGAAEGRSTAGAPFSAHPTIRKDYELQVTFPRRPGGRKPYTSNSFVNEDGDLFKTPQLLISANTLEELHGNLPTKKENPSSCCPRKIGSPSTRTINPGCGARPRRPWRRWWNCSTTTGWHAPKSPMCFVFLS